MAHPAPPHASADKLGKIAMRIIAVAIACAIVVVLIDKGIDGFPYGWWGFFGAIALCGVAAGVGQVE
jgi:hypothetical protein